MDYYFSVWKKYAVFSGRASRAEYWYFTLFNFIVSFLLFIIGGFLSLAVKNAFFYYFFTFGYFLAVVLPSLAVFVRRMHDIGKSGWWWLISLIPLLGTIWLTILLVLDGNPGENRYGPNPKAEVIEESEKNQPV